MKLEGSVFDGRHPDSDRTDLDLESPNFRSFSGRFTVNPVASLSISASWASIDPGGDGAHAAVHGARHRVTASLLHANRTAVRALRIATSMEPRTAPSMRLKALRWAPPSSTATFTAIPMATA